MAERKKKAFRTKAEREAWERHVDETIRWGRALVRKGLAELPRKSPEAPSA